MKRSPHQGPLIAAGILLGTGMGGFVDGILLHQILQWHNMLSSIRPPVDLVSMKYNMVWDGFFHAFTWTATAIGLVKLWRVGQRTDVPWSTSTFVGAILMGFGLFNAIEGTIDHELLGVHHVHPGTGQLAWDIGFIVLGLVLIAIGWSAIHHGRRDVTPRGGFVEQYAAP